MPQKRKASNVWVGNIQGARDPLSGKQQKSTPADSDKVSESNEKRKSSDEVVRLSLNTPKLTTSDGQWQGG